MKLDRIDLLLCDYDDRKPVKECYIGGYYALSFYIDTSNLSEFLNVDNEWLDDKVKNLKCSNEFREESILENNYEYMDEEEIEYLSKYSLNFYALTILLVSLKRLKDLKTLTYFFSSAELLWYKNRQSAEEYIEEQGIEIHDKYFKKDNICTLKKKGEL